MRTLLFALVGLVLPLQSTVGPTLPPTSTSAANSTSTSLTTTAAPAAASTGRPATVRVDVLPRTARVTLTSGSEPNPTVRTVSAKATVQMPDGRLDLRIDAAGYQTRVESVVLGPAGLSLTRRLDPVGQLHHHRYDARTGSNPKQVAFTPSGTELWVPLLGSRGVDVFRSSDGARLATIRLGERGGAVEVIFNAEGTRAYVSQMETASVYEIDTATRRVLRRMGTKGNWTKVLALSPDETTLYAANWVSNDVSVIELATGRVLRRIPTVRTPRGLVPERSGRYLFVAGFDGGDIERIDLLTGDSTTLLHTGGAMRHMVADPAGTVLYVDDMATARVHTVDVASGAVRTLAATDSHPNTIDLSADGTVLYVSNRGENNARGYNIPGPEWGSVVVLDSATGAVLDAIVGGNQTTGLDVSPDGRLLAFTDFLDNRLAVYDIPARDVLTAGAGGLAPSRRRLIVKPKAP